MQLIIATLILGLAGYNFMSLFHNVINKYEKISSGFILSSGIFISLSFPLGLIRNGYKPINIILLALLICIISMICNHFLTRKIIQTVERGRISSFVKAVWILIIFILISSLITNFYWPVRDWDAITLYDFRGRLFANEGYISPIMYTMEPNYYLAYPFFTSMAHTTVYVLSNYSPVIYYSILTSAFCLSFFHILKRKTNATMAAIGTLLLISTFDIYAHSLISYTNLPYVIYVFLGLIYSYDAKKDIKTYILSAIFIAISCWIRSDDPFWVIALLLSFYYAFANKKLLIIPIYIFIILAWRLPWNMYKGAILLEYATSIRTTHPNIQDSMTIFLNSWWIRLFEVGKFIIEKVLWYYNNYLVFFILTSLLALRSKLKDTYISKIVIFSFLAILSGGTYFLSFVYYKWDQVGGSAQRMMMILIPFIVYDTVVTIYSYLSSKKIIE